MAKNKNVNLEIEDLDLELDDDMELEMELDDDMDLELEGDDELDLGDDEFDLDDEEEEVKPTPKKTTKKAPVVEEEDEEMDFDFEEIEEDEEPAPVVKPKVEPKKEVVKPKVEPKKVSAPKVETKKQVTKAAPKKEEVEEKETVKIKPSSQAKLDLVVDKKAYSKLFDSVVMSKVNAYNEITAERAKGKTTRIPTSKAVARVDFASLIKAKMFSDPKYIKTFVKLLSSAGMDQDEALAVLLKDKISNKVFTELYELFTDTVEDVLKAEAGVVLLAKEDIRATLTGEYKESEIRDISSLKKTDKYTHVRKSDYYKVSCKSPVLSNKIEGGIIDKNGNFVPVEK